MTGFVDPHIYGHIIDYWLTPFPLGGGAALLEYANKGKPYILLLNKEHHISTEFERNLYKEFVKKNGYSRFFAYDIEDTNISHVKRSPL